MHETPAHKIINSHSNPWDIAGKQFVVDSVDHLAKNQDCQGRDSRGELDLSAFRQLQGIIHIDPQISNRAFKFSVSQE